MKLRIEIEKRRGRNLHVILQGVAGEGTVYDDSGMFAMYLEVCKAFTGGQDPLAEAALDNVLISL